MLVLGIDPGLATTGWGLVRAPSPQSYQVVRFGCVLTPATDPMVKRLSQLARDLRTLVRDARPQVAAVEDLYFAKDSRTAASVGHARGVILHTLDELGLAVYEYNPRQVKMALTGYGAADKSQMQNMVQRLLGLRDLPRPDDAADALAIALCHLNTFRPEAVAG